MFDRDRRSGRLRHDGKADRLERRHRRGQAIAHRDHRRGARERTADDGERRRELTRDTIGQRGVARRAAGDDGDVGLDAATGGDRGIDRAGDGNRDRDDAPEARACRPKPRPKGAIGGGRSSPAPAQRVDEGALELRGAARWESCRLRDQLGPDQRADGHRGAIEVALDAAFAKASAARRSARRRAACLPRTAARRCRAGGGRRIDAQHPLRRVRRRGGGGLAAARIDRRDTGQHLTKRRGARARLRLRRRPSIARQDAEHARQPARQSSRSRSVSVRRMYRCARTRSAGTSAPLSLRAALGRDSLRGAATRRGSSIGSPG